MRPKWRVSRSPERRPRRSASRTSRAQLGVSTGTVDRALNGKPDVSPATRARVLELAETLGYRPTSPRATCSRASSCASRSTCHGEIALFWDALRDGIREAAAPFAPALHVDFRTYPRLGDGDIPLLEEALADGTNGLIIAPGNPAALAPHLREAARRNIPVVCVVTDAPDSPRLTVGLRRPVHGRRGRRRAARPVPARRRPGRRSSPAGWRRRITPTSCAASCRACRRRRPARSRSARSSRRTTTSARPSPRARRAAGPSRPEGLYVSTVNSLPVLRAAEQEGRLAGLTVVTTDLFPELVDWIRAGKVAATVYQRPLTQGRVALQALYQFLHHGERVRRPRQRVVPLPGDAQQPRSVPRAAVGRSPRSAERTGGTPRRDATRAPAGRRGSRPRAPAAIVLSAARDAGRERPVTRRTQT